MNDQVYLEVLDGDEPDENKVIAVSGLRGKTAPEIIGALSRAVATGGPELRRVAAWALAESAANLARAAADAVIEDERLSTVEGLTIIGQLVRVAQPALLKALNDTADQEARVRAAAIILSLPHDAAMTMLDVALEDDGALGVFAASVLVQHDNTNALDRLVSSLISPDEPSHLRLLAAVSLIRVADADLAATLAEALTDPGLVAAWVDHDPAGTADLVDLARDSPWQILQAASKFAYDATVSRLQAPTNEDVDDIVEALISKDHNPRSTAGQQLLNIVDADLVPTLAVAVERGFDDPDVVMVELTEVLKRLEDRRSVPILIKLASHDDWETRRLAIDGLGKIGDRAASPTVCATLREDPSEYVRKAAAVAIPEVADDGDGPLEALLHCVLKDPTVLDGRSDERVIRPAGNALARLQLVQAVPALCEGLKSDRAAVRRSAAWALGELAAPEALLPLLRTLEDSESPSVRRASAWALGMLRAEGAIENLIRALEDDDSEVRDQVAFALGEIRSEEGVQPLIAAVRRETAARGRPHVRARMIWALGKSKDPTAVELLTDSLVTDKIPEVRSRCAEALGEIADPGSAPSIASALVTEADPGTKEKIIHALGELAYEPARADLERLVLEDYLSEGVRRAAAQVLGRIGDVRTIRLLEQVGSADPAQSVRHAAQRAVDRLRGHFLTRSD